MINNVKAANMEKEFKKIRKFIESLAIKQNSKIKRKIVNNKGHHNSIHHHNPLFNNSLLNKMTNQNELIMVGKEMKQNTSFHTNSFRKDNGFYNRHEENMRYLEKTKRNFLTPETTLDNVERLINTLKPKLQEKSSFKDWQLRKPLDQITSRREFFL